jgi:hypothetical protein
VAAMALAIAFCFYNRREQAGLFASASRRERSLSFLFLTLVGIAMRSHLDIARGHT